MRFVPRGSASLARLFQVLLGVTWYATLVGAPLCAVLEVVTDWRAGPLPLTVPVGLRQAAPGLASVTGEFEVSALGGAAQLGCVALWLVGVLATLPAIWLLRRLVATVLAGDPFEWRNLGRLGGLGVALLVGGLCAAAATSSASRLVVWSTDGPYDAASLHVPGWALLGLVVIGLVDVFAVGARLKADNDLTI